jgi:hypothetical protein
MHQPKIIQRLSAVFAAVALAVCCASSASAAVTQLPAVQLTVNGAAVALDAHLTFNETFGVWLSDFQLAGNGWSITNGHASFVPDPFLDYGFSVKNVSLAAETFTFTFSVPFTDGPYNVLDSSHTSGVTDGRPNATGTVTITPGGGFSFVHNPQVDGVLIAGSAISTGCAPTGTPGFSTSCQGGSFSTVTFGPTGAAGTLGVIVSFVVSPGDIYNASGQVSLSAVPEPGTGLALFAGMAFLFGVIARRRIG